MIRVRVVMGRVFFMLLFVAMAFTAVLFGGTGKTAIQWVNGHATTQGRRQYQEDRLLAVSDLELGKNSGRVGVFAVFDGHIGYHASEFLVKSFKPKLLTHLPKDSPLKIEVLKDALNKTLLELEDTFVEYAYQAKLPDGSTACVLVVTDEHIVVGNVGDSRATACVRGQDKRLYALPLTSDHHPELPEERKRIESAGGIVLHGVINYHFPMSRAIGDVPMMKYGVIATPTISTWSDLKRDGFIVVASDGLYDGMEEQEVCDIALAAEEDFKGAKLAQTIADRALDRASKTSRDNISIVVVPLK